MNELETLLLPERSGKNVRARLDVIYVPSSAASRSLSLSVMNDGIGDVAVAMAPLDLDLTVARLPEPDRARTGVSKPPPRIERRQARLDEADYWLQGFWKSLSENMARFEANGKMGLVQLDGTRYWVRYKDRMTELTLDFYDAELGRVSKSDGALVRFLDQLKEKFTGAFAHGAPLP